MERLGELLPLFIFILIPIIRGLNNSKKQKNEYQRKKASKFPYQQSKPSSVKPWRSIIDEVGKDMKGLFEPETKPAKKAKTITKQDIKGRGEASSDMVMAEPYQHFEGKPIDIKDAEIKETSEKDKAIKSLKGKETKDKSLIFSSNPIVQGLIFSEIIGPPKSKR